MYLFFVFILFLFIYLFLVLQISIILKLLRSATFNPTPFSVIIANI